MLTNWLNYCTFEMSTIYERSSRSAVRSLANRSLCQPSDRKGDCVAHRSAATSELPEDWSLDVVVLCFHSNTYLKHRLVWRRKSLSFGYTKSFPDLSNDSNPRTVPLFALLGTGRKPNGRRRPHAPDFCGITV